MTALFTLIVLFVIAVIYLIAIPKLVTDNLRQNLFEIRTRLFEIAEKDKDFTFSHPLYKKFESQLNSTIKIAHICTLWHMIVYSIILKLSGKKWQSRESLLENFEKESINIQSKETKKELEQLIARYYEDVAFNIVVLSAPLTFATIVLTLILPILIWNSRQKLQNILFKIIQSQSRTYKHA